MEITHVHIVYCPSGSWAGMCIAVVFHPHLRQHTWSSQGTAAPRTRLWLRDRQGQVKLCLHTVWGCEVQWMFGCSCMTNLRPIHPHQFYLYHSCWIHLIWKMLLTLITAEPSVTRQASARSIPCNSTMAYSMNTITNCREKWICFTEQ